MKSDEAARSRTEAVNGLFGDARGRLLLELCGQPQTAVELARLVETSANAVRVHLDGLRRAGLVDYIVEKRGVGKPRHVYAITATAEDLLSAAYTQALQALLDTLRNRLNGGFAPLLRDVGKTLANERNEKKRGGVRGAVSALESLGASVATKRKAGATTLTTRCCPLAAVTRTTPQMCEMVESLLATSSGLPVTERCTRGAHPRCSFVVDV